MKSIKDIFEHYSEAPSEDVWQRISAQLDMEMPVGVEVVKRSGTTFWRWAAVVVAALVVGGVITYGVLRHPSSNQDIAKVEKVEVETPEEAKVEGPESVADAQVENMEEEQPVVREAVVADPAPVNATEAASTVNAAKESESVNARKTNVRQEVLPANSTLAKQLAADPVLKNLSDENVDWSLPTHLSIPNLFTPNEDGVNDLFIIEGLENYSSPKLVVRDKNSRIVYQSQQYRNNWGGENCPDGIYTYELTFSYNGIENQATGKVRIIRA